MKEFALKKLRRILQCTDQCDDADPDQEKDIPMDSGDRSYALS